MTIKITFPVNDSLQRVIDHALNAEEHQITFDEVLDPKNHIREGITSKDIFKMTPQEIETIIKPEVKKPAVWLVKDNGIYLMSNGKLRDDERSPLVYANECNPETDPDWYFTAEAVSGDDFGVSMDIDFFIQALKDGAKTIAMKFNDDGSFSASYRRPRKASRKPAPSGGPSPC